MLNEASKSEVYLPEGVWHPFNQAGEILTGPRHAGEEALTCDSHRPTHRKTTAKLTQVPLDQVPAFVRLGTDALLEHCLKHF